MSKSCPACSGPVVKSTDGYEEDWCTSRDIPTRLCPGERRSGKDRRSSTGEPDGVALIAAERRRQVEEEGWTPRHDDQHHDGALALAAASYAMHAAYDRHPQEAPSCWPWSRLWWKPSSRLRCLEKAGALVAAEIDRLQRATPTDEPEEEDHA